jgi:hypothetical protein
MRRRANAVRCVIPTTYEIRELLTDPLAAPFDEIPHSAPPEPGSVTFPLGWLLDHAAPPIKYRALCDVAALTDAAREASWLPYSYAPAVELSLAQSADGMWNNALLSVPSRGIEGVGTIQAIRRLLEYGWDKNSPPLLLSRRVLFRLLAEDDDPAYLFELGRGKIDEDQARFGRQLVREAAAATLAQAGYEDDPRLRGAARRILDRTAEFLESPLAEKPWVRVGNKQVLAPEAAPPSIYTLHMLAHLPLVRTENYAAIDALFKWISHPMPRQEPVQLVGKKLLPVPHLVLGDQLMHRNALEDDVPAGMAWLELVTRLGFLRRQENWLKMFERLLDDRDRAGVWHPHKGMAHPKTHYPYVWSTYPLESPSGGEERWTDFTFRLGLIARLAGRGIDLI